jgi:hypothetical protein
MNMDKMMEKSARRYTGWRNWAEELGCTEVNIPSYLLHCQKWKVKL